MKRTWMVLNLMAALLLILGCAVPAAGKGETTGYQTGFKEWATFSDWSLTNGLSSGEEITLDLTTAPTENDPYSVGAYYGGNFYNGGSYQVGEAVGPVHPVTGVADVREAIVSWNAETPAGTWVEALLLVKLGDRWTKPYNMGIWASDTGTIQRHSVRLQGDADGYVATDTWVRGKTKLPVTAFQVKVRLFSTNANTPTVNSVALAYSSETPRKVTVSSGSQANWNTLVDLPQCSQMVYSDGGNVWCSPTSTSMVLGYYGYMPGACEPRVRDVVVGVYDWVYDGHGNWPFNTAYAASQGYEASVRRFSSMDQVEQWVKAGVPVVFSFAWGKGELTGAAIDSSAGHLAVIVGFDGSGNPIVNDPAHAADGDIRRTYLRSELEPLWLLNSGGTVYLIYPVGMQGLPQ